MVKKGIVFSTIAILLVLFFVFIFSTIFTEYVESSDDFYSLKADAIGTYFDRIVDYYLPIILSNTGHAAVEAMVNFTGSNKTFIPEERFAEVYRSLMMNGTIHCNFSGLPQDCYWVDSYLEKNNLETWFFNMSVNMSDSSITKSEETFLFTEGDSLTISVEPYNIRLYHETPWTIIVEAYVLINFESPEFFIGGVEKKISTEFPITNLRNPSYLYHSDNQLEVLFDNTSEIFNYWDIDKLEGAIKNHTFHANILAPSFLMRLKGNYSPSPYGAISFIDPVWVNSTGVFSSYRPYLRRTFTDPAFFIETKCDESIDSFDYLYNITSFSGENGLKGFRLNFNSTVKYLGVDFSSSEIEVACRG